MPQNLIIIHLESISNLLFYHHRMNMPTLWTLMGESAVFSRFYSASTSTFMSLADFMQGDSSELDHHLVYPTEAGCLLGRSSNLFCDLLAKGYETRCMRYGSFRDYASEDVDNYLGLPSQTGLVTEWFDDYDAYCRAIPAFLQESGTGKPFALHLLNLVTHVRDTCPEKMKNKGLNTTFTSAFRLLDKSVTILLEELERLNLLANTMIVVMGDHGNELWYHGLGKGFMHSVEPYGSLCSVPLFIFSSMINPSLTDTLISMVDLKPTIWHMLFPDEAPEERETPFAGINIVTEGRKLAFSQNLLALQLEQQDPSKGLLKSYSVTDGTYRLVATSGGDKPKNGGLEFFCESMDPNNIFNLMEFMQFNSQGDPVGFNPHDARHPHFLMNMMIPTSIMNLTGKFQELRSALQDFIREKEKWALPNLIGNTYKLFPGSVFKNLRRCHDWTF